MNLKSVVTVFVLSLCMAIPALANDDSNKGFESSTGTQYEYDLGTPSGQIRYDVDPSAQIRDSISVDPRRDIDKSLGQHGGGIYND
jgi:hypothetical protein